MKEILCGAIGLLCATVTSPADDNKIGPFNRRVDLPLATVAWDIDTEIVKGLVRDYLTSRGEIVKTGKQSSLSCDNFYGAKKTCRYVVWVEVPFDATKP